MGNAEYMGTQELDSFGRRKMVGFITIQKGFSRILYKTQTSLVSKMTQIGQCCQKLEQHWRHQEWKRINIPSPSLLFPTAGAWVYQPALQDVRQPRRWHS